MGFVVLHMEKAHGSDSGTTAHIERFIIPKNADPTRTHLNRRLIEYPDGIKDRSAAIQQRLEEAGLTRKIGSNQVRAIRINVSGTHEDMKRIEEEGRLDEWCADNLKYFADTFGKENIVAAHLHRDEETPHIHVTLVPMLDRFPSLRSHVIIQLLHPDGQKLLLVPGQLSHRLAHRLPVRM